MDARRDDVSLVLRALVVLVSASAISADAAGAGRRHHSQTLSHGAIAYHAASGSVGWATDRTSARDAKVEALRQCGHEQCEVVAAVTRGCAALAKDAKKFIAQQGATRQEAETKALRRCGERCEILVWTCTR